MAIEFTTPEDLKPLTRRLRDAERAIARGDAERGQLLRNMAALAARVTALEQPTDPTPEPEPEPEPEPDPVDPVPQPEPGAALMGVSVNGAVRKDYVDLHPLVKVARVFWQDMSQPWDREGQHKQFPDALLAVSCSERIAGSGTRAQRMDAALATIPDADKARIVAFCDTHEPENNAGFSGAQQRANQAETAPVIRAHGLRVASCLMQWTLQAGSRRDWRDWVDPEVVDLMAWDVYNSKNKANPPGYESPDSMLDRIVNIGAETGKPYAAWETGTNNFGDVAPRVEWTSRLRAAFSEKGFEHAIWFDRPSTSGSGWDATLDRATAEAWLT